ncbi:MAG: hypothetical protein J0M24_15865 [Verrucomicrobia bacterium]|nr:hypothetical protein [Verrucomicrobiota bacterium]
MLTKPHFLTAASVSLLLGVFQAGAALNPVSQDRSVEASSSAAIQSTTVPDSEGFAAPDFGHFNETADSSALTTLGALFVAAFGTAEQNSRLTPNRVVATGEATAGVLLSAVARGTGKSKSESLFQYEFTVATPSTYSLLGSVDSESVVSGGALIPSLETAVVFEDVGLGVVLFETLTFDETFSISGTLLPGTYRISAEAWVDVSQASSASQFRSVNGSSSFELDFKARNVPEAPTQAACLVLGALGGASVWRRRRLA